MSTWGDVDSREITPEAVYRHRRALGWGDRRGLRAPRGGPGRGRGGGGAGPGRMWPLRRARRGDPRVAPDGGGDSRGHAQHPGADHQLQQLLRVLHGQGGRRPALQGLQDGALVGGRGGPGGEAPQLHRAGAGGDVPARGAGLPPALRRRLVDGHPLAGLPPEEAPGGGGAHGAGPVRALRDGQAPGGDAGAEVALLPLALRGGAAPGRGPERPRPAGHRALREAPAEPERGPPAPGGALEVRL